MKSILTLLTVAATVGVAAGLISPTTEPVRAQVPSSSVARINPGPQGPTSDLTCGWHLECTNQGIYTRQALDWGNNAGQSVYLRTWGLSADMVFTSIAFAIVGARANSSSFCTETEVIFRDLTGSTGRSEIYTHTEPAADQKGTPIAAGYNTYAFTEYRVGTTVTAAVENARGCPITGPHLHQYGFSQPGYKPISQNRGTGPLQYPDAQPGVPEPDPVCQRCNVPVANLDRWQNEIQFSY